MGKSLLRVIAEKDATYEVTHKNSREEYKKFIIYTTVTRNLITIILGSLLLASAGLALMKYFHLYLGILITVCAGLFPFILVLIAYLAAVGYLKKNPGYLDYINQYRFYSDVMYVCSYSDKKFSESVIAYENLYKIVETFWDLYIYLNKTQVVIVEKKEIERERYHAFREFLLNHVSDGKFKHSLGFKIRRKKAAEENNSDQGKREE